MWPFDLFKKETPEALAARGYVWAKNAYESGMSTDEIEAMCCCTFNRSAFDIGANDFLREMYNANPNTSI